ncbi:hypothetical protein D9M68_797740 [compost metagenome]
MASPQRAVVLQRERLMGYPMVRREVEARALTLHGWHYVIEEGEAHVFDAQQGHFIAAYAVQTLIAQRAVITPASGLPSPMVVQTTPGIMPGKKCGECGAHAAIRKDGCDYCTQCGHLGGVRVNTDPPLERRWVSP